MNSSIAQKKIIGFHTVGDGVYSYSSLNLSL